MVWWRASSQNTVMSSGGPAQLWGSITWSPMTTCRMSGGTSAQGHFNSEVSYERNPGAEFFFFHWSMYYLLYVMQNCSNQIFSPKIERSQLLWISLVTFTLTMSHIVPLCWLSGPKVQQNTGMKEPRSESNPVVNKPIWSSLCNFFLHICLLGHVTERVLSFEVIFLV